MQYAFPMTARSTMAVGTLMRLLALALDQNRRRGVIAAIIAWRGSSQSRPRIKKFIVIHEDA